MSESVLPSSLPLEAKTESIPALVVANPVAAPVSAADEPAAKKAKVETTPVKEKTPKKRALSQAERTQREAEALIGDLNKEGSGDGPRRTRSQTRGTPAPSIVEKISPKPRAPRRTDTPAVKKTPASGSESAKKGRGRGRKGKPGRKPGVKAAEQEEEEAGGEQEAGDIEEGADATDGQEPEPAVVNENGQDESTEAAPVVAAVPVPESKPTPTPEKTVEPTPPPPPPVVSASPVKEIPSVTPQPQEPQAPSQPEPNTAVVAEDDGWN